VSAPVTCPANPDIDSKTTHAPAADRRTASANSPPAINHPATGPDVGAVVLNLFFTHSRIKQHLDDERAMRIETRHIRVRDHSGKCARITHLSVMDRWPGR
jgi:hypothetical protein